MDLALREIRFVPTQYDDLIADAAAEHLPDGYPWQLYRAQLVVESGLNPSAKSTTGARGIAQFMPDSWPDWGRPGADPAEPGPAIDAGARYMEWLIAEWSWPRPPIDRWCLAMACYNAGIKHVLEAQKASGGQSLYAPIMAVLPDVTNTIKAEEALNYAPRILDIAKAHVLYGARGEHSQP